MKKIFKNPILTFILGAITFSCITSAFAYSIIASSVGFTPTDDTWEVENVSKALDDLYLIINKPLIELASGEHIFSSGNTSLFKMNITVSNTEYLTNNNNLLTVNIPGKYLIVPAIGGNTSPNQGCTYSGYMRLFINDEQVLAFQNACSYTVRPYIADLNKGDQFYLGLYGDGSNYSKKAVVYIYKM